MAKKCKKVKNKKFNPNPGTSEFNGSVISLIGWNILYYFGALLTLGFALPWLECGFRRWVARHTKINGLQVVFDGKGGQLFWKNVGWFLLCIITLGIYLFWLPIKKQQWVTKHTYVENRVTYSTPVNVQNSTPAQPAQAPQYPQYPQYAQYSQYPQTATPCCHTQQQYYYPCGQYPQYPQGGCCRYQR